VEGEKIKVVDSSQDGAAGGQPPVEPVKMKGLLKGLRYISQIFGKSLLPTKPAPF
jgi:hypothetical protein